jgi:hypothetical protein
MTALQNRRQVAAALRHLRTSGLRHETTRFHPDLADHRWHDQQRLRISLRITGAGMLLTVFSRDVDLDMATTDVKQILDALVFAGLLPADLSTTWCRGYLTGHAAGRDAFAQEMVAGLAAYDTVLEAGKAVRP